jgi:mono/diheme cytochrome c family protein
MNSARASDGRRDLGPKRSFTLSRCRVVALSVLLAAGCNWPGKPNPEDRPVREDRVTQFATLYGQNCAGCHGADGQFGPAPPLNDPLFRALVPEKELESVIAKGRPGTLMPAFGTKDSRLPTGVQIKTTLTPVQIQVLVQQIKGTRYKVESEDSVPVRVVRDSAGVAPEWGEPPAAPDNAPPYLLPEAKADGSGSGDKDRGDDVFTRACSMCHGDRGEGNAQGKNRINEPDFLALNSDQVLRRYAITGRPDLGMPDYAGKTGRSDKFRPLTSRDVTDLVALLAYWRQGGAANK